MAFPIIHNLKPRALAWAALATLGIVSLPTPSAGQTSPLSFAPVSAHGFGDYQNSYSWSMAWFEGNLYVGTNRDFPCVEDATLEFYYPSLASLVPILFPTHIPCPSNPADMDLRAQVWRYTPTTKKWKMIYQSPLIPNTQAPGKLIARDIGYRDMQQFKGPNGQQSLYIVGCTSREYTPGLPPPRILRMHIAVNPHTGAREEVFTPVPQDPGTYLATFNAITFRATAVYNGKFYVTASPSLTGDGYLLESATPWLGNNSFRQVTPTSLLVYELNVFNNLLYIGAGDTTNGYSVSSTNCRGNPPYTLNPVVTDGAGRGAVMTSVVSMYVFNGQLYVGSAGWYSTLLPSCELIRINPDNSWQVVTGNPRQTNLGMLYPISGLGDGFGNPFNAHVWRMNSEAGTIYAGTNDDSWSLMGTFLAPYFQYQFGFDLWASQDGASWTAATINGFGDPYDFGVRCLVPTQYGMYLGSVDYVEGTQVMLGTGKNLAYQGSANVVENTSGPVRGTRRTGPTTRAVPLAIGTPPTPPARLFSETYGGAAVLSWDPVPQAAGYRIYRSDYNQFDLKPVLGMLGPNSWALDIAQTGAAPVDTVATLPGPYVPIATTAQPVFNDRKIKKGRTYAYRVQAVDEQGRASGNSNTISVPNFAPQATFDDVQAIFANLVKARQAAQPDVARPLELLEQSRRAAAEGNFEVSRQRLSALRELTTSNTGKVLKPWVVDNLNLTISRLERRVGLAGSGTISLPVLNRPAPPPGAAREPARRRTARLPVPGTPAPRVVTSTPSSRKTPRVVESELEPVTPGDK
jgi:hypothetical protein